MPENYFLNFKIYERNLSKIALRDFSLTFKVTSQQALDPKKGYSPSVILTNKLFIWYLLVLIITQAESKCETGFFGGCILPNLTYADDIALINTSV